MTNFNSLPLKCRIALLIRIFHKIVESEIHRLHLKYSDPGGERKAVRKSDSFHDFHNCTNAEDMVRIAFRRRWPKKRERKTNKRGWAKKKPKPRKLGGYSLVFNPPTLLQAIIQALPHKYFKIEQERLYQAFKDHLTNDFGAVPMMTALHSDKVRLHAEALIIKFDENHETPKCFTGLGQDGAGFSAVYGEKVAKGEISEADDIERKGWNTGFEVAQVQLMRERAIGYLKEIGPTEAKSILARALRINDHLEGSMSGQGRKRRKRSGKKSLRADEFADLFVAAGIRREELLIEPIREQSDFEPWADGDFDTLKSFSRELEREIKKSEDPETPDNSSLFPAPQVGEVAGAQMTSGAKFEKQKERDRKHAEMQKNLAPAIKRMKLEAEREKRDMDL